MANNPHMNDANSNAYFQSIEEIDANGFLVDNDSQDSTDIDVIEVDVPTFGEGGSISMGDFLNHDASTREQEEAYFINDDGSDCDHGEDGSTNIDGGRKRGNNFDGESKLGKVFNTQEDAYSLYNLYALSKGFGIRIHWAIRSRTTGQVINRQDVCNKEGIKSLKDKRQTQSKIKCCRETRTSCATMMGLAFSKSGDWVVNKFLDIHNHALNLTPSKLIKHRSHSKFHRTMACKALIFELNQTGLKPCQITRAINDISGGQEVDITPRQCFNVLSIERKNNVGQKCYGIIKHFQEEARSDSTHYFAMDLARDGSLRSVFWADGRSRASYSQFGDGWSLRAKFNKAIEDARDSPSDIAKLDACLDRFLEDQAIRKRDNQITDHEILSHVCSTAGISQVEPMHQITIRDPIAPFMSKGCPKIATLHKSGIELAKEAKKQIKCALCHVKGHKRAGCSKRKVVLHCSCLRLLILHDCRRLMEGNSDHMDDGERNSGFDL